MIGIAQAAITAARLMAPNFFSVLYVLDKSQKIIENVLKLHNAEKKCCSIRSIGLGVLESEDKERLLKALTEKGRACMEEDGAECILLGCAGYVQFAEKMKRGSGHTGSRRSGTCSQALRGHGGNGSKDPEADSLRFPGRKDYTRIKRHR